MAPRPAARAAAFRRRINLWPPFLASGIRLEAVSEDFRTVEVALRQRWFNRTPNGLHFGGSLYAMVDPIYVLMLREVLGRGYLVVDRHAEIDFVAPGRGTVRARFVLEDAVLDEIRAATADGGKALPRFLVEVRDAAGTLVAGVTKTVYVRRKGPPGAADAQRAVGASTAKSS